MNHPPVPEILPSTLQNLVKWLGDCGWDFKLDDTDKVLRRGTDGVWPPVSRIDLIDLRHDAELAGYAPASRGRMRDALLLTVALASGR